MCFIDRDNTRRGRCEGESLLQEIMKEKVSMNVKNRY